MEYHSVKNNEIMPYAATWTELEIIILSEVSQTEKDTYYISLICEILKKIDTNELTKQKQTQTFKQTYENEQKKVGSRGIN